MNLSFRKYVHEEEDLKSALHESEAHNAKDGKVGKRGWELFKPRQSRIFSIFSLVRFKNEPCTPSGTKNTYTGTCYLATECAQRVRITVNVKILKLILQ